MVSKIADSLRHDTESGWRLYPSHGGGHGNCDQLWFSFILREHQSEAGAVGGIQEHAVEAIFDVVLAG